MQGSEKRVGEGRVGGQVAAIKQPLLSEAYQVQQQLLKTIEVMDEKIEEVIKQHEAEFLLAYRNHIKTMKEELNSIKSRAEEHEKKMLSNDRAVYLQKQLILFREEALRLYDKLEEKTQECEHQRSQARDFEKMKAIVEKENKELLKESKNLEARLALHQNNSKELEQEVLLLKQELDFLKASKPFSKAHTLHTSPFTDNVRQPQPQPPPPPPSHILTFTPKPKDSLPLSSSKKQSRRKADEWMDHELKNWFLECIQRIRREVAQRKVYGYKSEDVRSIGSWEEFRMIDKLRLLEMFMQNEKLLVWMYQKIFPTRIAEVQHYLRNPLPESRTKSKSAHITADHLVDPSPDPTLDLPNLDHPSEAPPQPRVVGLKGKKYEVRKRIEMRQGKLNLSSINSDI